MAKGKSKPEVLYRVAKFPIYPNESQFQILRKVSDNLWMVWNSALEERRTAYSKFVAPLYEGIKESVKNQNVAETARLRGELKAAYRELPTLFDQINALTPRRNQQNGFAAVPRNWQEETLDTLDGAYKSFLALRKNGDFDARPPRARSEWDFCEVPGRFGFKIQSGEFALSCGKLSLEPLHFPIPEHQQGMLSRAIAIKKFTLYRDERDMRKPGRFFASLAYEIAKPEEKPFVPEEAVFVSPGASSIGVISPMGEVVIPLWRADKHWKPHVDAAADRAKNCAKGSRKWRKRTAARFK